MSLEPYYGFRSLHAFKTLFLAFRDEADLPRVGIALSKAYLLGGSMRQLMRLGNGRQTGHSRTQTASPQ